MTLGFEPLPPSMGGAVCARWRDGDTVIVIDPDLSRTARNAALAHELVHDELGGGKESVVHRVVAERLVPPAALRTFVESRAGTEGVTVWEIAEEFDVPEAVARHAVELLEGR